MGNIILPCVALPLFVLFMYHYKKAKREGIIPSRPNSGRTNGQSIVHYLHEFDVVGLLLISVGFAFFLLPFNLYTMEAKGWGSALIICFLVVGILFIAAFVIWEKSHARVKLTPWGNLRDRTVLGTCIVGFTLFLSIICWNPFFSSYLQVVNGLNVTEASYVVQSGTVVQILGNIVAGVVISLTGRYKPISMFLALPLALLNLFCYIGTAVGFTISSAIWQGTLPKKLALQLPIEDPKCLETIFSSIEEQLAHEWGSPGCVAIQHAYADTSQLLLITGVAVWIIGLMAMLAWKNMNVKGVKQNKGFVV